MAGQNWCCGTGGICKFPSLGWYRHAHHLVLKVGHVVCTCKTVWVSNCCCTQAESLASFVHSKVISGAFTWKAILSMDGNTLLQASLCSRLSPKALNGWQANPPDKGWGVPPVSRETILVTNGSPTSPWTTGVSPFCSNHWQSVSWWSTYTEVLAWQKGLAALTAPIPAHVSMTWSKHDRSMLACWITWVSWRHFDHGCRPLAEASHSKGKKLEVHLAHEHQWWRFVQKQQIGKRCDLDNVLRRQQARQWIYHLLLLETVLPELGPLWPPWLQGTEWNPWLTSLAPFHQLVGDRAQIEKKINEPKNSR